MTYEPYGQIPSDLTLRINEIAGQVAGQFDHSEADDLAGAAWEWIGSYPTQSAKWFYDATDGARKFSWKQSLRDVRKVMVSYAKRDRAAAIGLVLEDQYTYATKVIETYLPYIWHTEVLATIGEPREGPGAKTDPAKGGDSQASAFDVREAFDKTITPGGNWHKALFLAYAVEWTQQEIGEQLGVDQTTVSRYIKQAIQAMAEYLNGPEDMPHMTLGDGPGTRKAVSNSAAISSMRLD